MRNAGCVGSNDLELVRCGRDRGDWLIDVCRDGHGWTWLGIGAWMCDGMIGGWIGISLWVLRHARRGVLRILRESHGW